MKKMLARDYPVVIYHDNCLDGFTAAYAAWLRFGSQAHYIPAAYQKPIEFDLEDRAVYVLDFSFKRKPLEQMLNSLTGPQSVTIVDHHLSAIRDLEGLEHSKLDLRLDTRRSGAVLAWRFFHGVLSPIPELFLHVQDRDLWKFDMNGTEEVTAYLQSHERTFQNWSEICDIDIEKIKQWGSHIRRAQLKECREWAKTSWMAQFGEFRIPVINCPSYMASDLGNMLCQGYPFAMTYYQDGDTVNVSLRSDADGVDVSQVASQYGGGGHYHAAGFRLPERPGWLPVDKATKV